MNFIQNLLSDETIYALGWTMVHSLWQGMLIAFVMALVLFGLQKRSAKLRYEIASVSLFLVFLASLCTFTWLLDQTNTGPLETLLLSGVAETGSQQVSVWQSFIQSATTYFNHHMPLIVTIWLVGAAFFLLRLIGGLAYIQRLKHQYNSPLPAYWQQQLQRLMKRIPLRREVRFMESALVKVPMVIGYFKPIILMPLGAVNNLSSQEVEAIIAHELAHVWRNDYLLNIILSFIEVLFYYHPAVWFISANVRSERENCADDIAIQLCGNSLTYAKALVSLQELNPSVPAFAMPFSGSKNQLLHRVQRILKQPQTRSNILEKLMATSMLLLAVLFLSVSSGHSSDSSKAKTISVESTVEVPQAAERNYQVRTVVMVSDTIPDKKKKSVKRKKIITKTDDQEILLEIENGNISKLEIDGEVIPEEEYGDYQDLIDETREGVPAPPAPPAPPVPPVAPVPPAGVTPPAPPAPPAPPSFRTKHIEKIITTQKDEEGQTVIIINGGDEDDFEILVDDDQEVIYIDGMALEEGDSLIIAEINPHFQFHWEGFPNNFEFHNLGHLDSLIDIGKDLHFEFKYPEGMLRQFEWKEEWPEELKEELEKLNEEMDQLRLNWKEENEEKRKKIRLEMKERSKELRALYSEMNEKQREQREEMRQQLREAHQQHREVQVRLREDARRLHEDAERARRSAQHRHDYENKMAILKNELVQDGLLEQGEPFSFSLDDKKLKVNGKKQSKEMHEKYLDWYKELHGLSIDGNFNIQINEN